MLGVTGQRGKKYNDFQGKRLGLIVNNFEDEETLADVLSDPDPTQPGVSGFTENFDFSREPEDYHTSPGVFTQASTTPSNKIRSMADMLKPQETNEGDNGVVGDLKFLEASDRPERAERNKKVDKLVRLAQFANLIGQGVSAASGGFASGQDITKGYWDRIAAMDMQYADQLKDWSNQVFQANRYNTDLYNDAILQQRGIEADAAADELGFQRDVQMKQMDIDGKIKQAKEEAASKIAYNRSIVNKNQNDRVKNLINSQNSLLREKQELVVPTLEDVEFGKYSEEQRASAISRLQALERDIAAYDEEIKTAQGIETEDAQVNSSIPNNQSVGRTFTPAEAGQLTSTVDPVDSTQSQTNPNEARNVLNSIESDLQSGVITKEQAIPQIAQILMRERGMDREAALELARRSVNN